MNSRPVPTVEPLLLRRQEVETLCGVSRAFIYKHMRAGTFPKAVRLGSKTVRWRRAEILAWLDRQPRSDGEPD